MEILLAFGNIFGGILFLLIISRLWARFEKWFHKKLQYDMKKIFYIFSSIIFVMEIVLVTAIHFIYHFDMIDIIFAFDTFLLLLLIAIPYHAQPILNVEQVHNRNYIDRSDKLEVKVSQINQTPLFIASLVFMIISVPVIVVYCLV
jgi:hypothetical protein